MGYKVNMQNELVTEELMSKLLELGIEIEVPEEDKEEPNKKEENDNTNSED